jgi:hypothetical protein
MGTAWATGHAAGVLGALLAAGRSGARWYREAQDTLLAQGALI